MKGRKLTYEEKQDPSYSAIVKFLSVLVVEDDHHTACVHDSCLQIAGRRSVAIDRLLNKPRLLQGCATQLWAWFCPRGCRTPYEVLLSHGVQSRQR